MQKIYKNTKLYIFNYPSTGFLECISKNIPAIIFMPNFKKSFDLDNIPILKKLNSNKIIITNEEEMSTFISNNWIDLRKWWLDKDVQSIVLEFRELFAKTNNYSTINTIIAQILKENETTH